VNSLRPHILLLLFASAQCAALLLSLPAWRASGHGAAAARGGRGISLLAVGLFLLAGRGTIPGALSTVVANGCIALGVALGYDALRALFELPEPARWERAAPVLGILALAAVWAADGSVDKLRYAPWRALFHVLALGSLHVGWASALWRRAPKPWSLATRYVFFSAVTALALNGVQLVWAALPGVSPDPQAATIVPVIVAFVTANSLLVTLGAILQVEARERDRLINANAQLRQAAQTDPLTGLANRRHLEAVAAIELTRTRRWGVPMAVLMIDADHFKSINDRFGHGAGDEVLRELAARCSRAIRGHDVLARWGGEEFVALLPRCDLAAATVVAERMLSAVRDRPIDAIGERMTVSVGVALCAADDRELGPVIARADRALYQAKRAGRARCAVDEDGR
jgi:diguanylate cyclase (GGDEF)-like protein